MDDEDFRALIEALARQLREVGAGDIADERHYFHPDREGGEARLLGPQKHLVEMLSAFERYLAARDRATYRTSLARMNDVLYGDGPRGAVFEALRDTDREPIVVSLGEAPELGELREETRRLIGRLLESRLPPRSLA